jgi:putative PIN family toxin of toxin-antitoxin system
MPKSKPLKIIIDTNLWVSFIISNKLTILDGLLVSQKISLLFSEELINEIGVTITKPKLKKYFASNGLEEMLIAFEPFIDLIKVRSSVTVCRDPNDNFLLALAKDGKADYLLTGDKDLLDIVKFGKTKIISITTFLETTKHLL